MLAHAGTAMLVSLTRYSLIYQYQFTKTCKTNINKHQQGIQKETSFIQIQNVLIPVR